MSKEPFSPSSILIIKTSSLGDIVQSFPLLHAIKDNFPEAKIDWVVEKNGSDLVTRHPLINQIFVLDTKSWKKFFFSKKTRKEVKEFLSLLRKKSYDLVLDLQGNCKSGLVTLLSRSKKKVGFSFSSVREWPNILATTHRVKIDQSRPIRSQYLHLLSGFINDPDRYLGAKGRLEIFPEEQKELDRLFTSLPFTAKRMILLCPFAKRRTKELPLELFAHLINSVRKDGDVFLISWSTQEEKEKAIFLQQLLKKDTFVFNHIYKLGILEGMLEKASFVIGMDSFLIHLCGYSTQTPTFAFFGPSSSSCYRPSGKHGFYQQRCPYGHTFQKTCPHLRSCRKYPCLTKIDQVEASELLSSFWKESSI